MAGKNTAAYAIFPSRAEAETVVNELTRAGFSSQDVSVLMSDTSGTRDFARRRTPRPRRALRPAQASAARLAAPMDFLQLLVRLRFLELALSSRQVRSWLHSPEWESEGR